MANNFKRYMASATIAGTTLVTIGASVSAVVIGINAANKNSVQSTISLRVNSFYQVKDAPIPSGSALSLLDGKLVLEGGDVITIEGSVDNGIDVILSVMEKS